MKRPFLALALLAVLAVLSRGSARSEKAASPASAKSTPGSTPSGGGESAPPGEGETDEEEDELILGEGRWVEARRQTLFKLMPTVGAFRASRTTKLGSQVAGRVEEVFADVGDRVKKGQKLVALDASFFEIEVDQARAGINSAKVGADDAKLKLERAMGLWGDGKNPAISRQFLDDARSAHALALARVLEREQELRFAERRLEEAIIRAPYDGVVGQRLVDPGEPVQAMFVTPLMEVQDIDTLELHFSMAQENLGRVKPGLRVLFRVRDLDGGEGAGVIDTVFPVLDEATRSFRCRVTLKNQSGVLRPGLLAEVGVVESEIKNALAVPRGALEKTSAGWMAKVEENGKAAERPVAVGYVTLLDQAEIVEGLKEGDKVWLPRSGADPAPPPPAALAN